MIKKNVPTFGLCYRLWLCAKTSEQLCIHHWCLYEKNITSDSVADCCYVLRRMNNRVCVTGVSHKWKITQHSDYVADHGDTFIRMDQRVFGTSLIKLPTLNCARHSIWILEYVVNILYSYSYLNQFIFMTTPCQT